MPETQEPKNDWTDVMARASKQNFPLPSPSKNPFRSVMVWPVLAALMGGVVVACLTSLQVFLAYSTFAMGIITPFLNVKSRQRSEQLQNGDAK